MKHLLHWGSYAIIAFTALPIQIAYGVWAYVAALLVLSIALLMQWVEGKFYSGSTL